MEKFFTKKLTKKGFTLAELLIVVAIIAVLTAIAAPLFIGKLNDAETAVKEANIRAVRGAAVAEILTNPTKSEYLTDAKLTGPWKATAKITANGGIEGLKITQESAGTDECKASTETGYKYEVTVYLTNLAVPT